MLCAVSSGLLGGCLVCEGFVDGVGLVFLFVDGEWCWCVTRVIGNGGDWGLYEYV